MTFKKYLELLVHVLIVTCIILSLPIFICCVFYNRLPDWLVCVMSISSAIIFTFYPSIKYIMYVGPKIFK